MRGEKGCIMRYSGVKTDENLRFLKCPVCGNSEFSTGAEFCKICGSAVYNYCQDLYDQDGYRVSAGCGRPNPGDSRFCEYCGNPTLLYKYLTHWEDEKVHLEKYGNNEQSEPCIVEPGDTPEDDAPPKTDDLTTEFSKFLEDDLED